MQDWDDLRFALAVHRTGSLTAAGRVVGADQSTVGRRISALEAGLRTKVFFRTRDGFVATPAGERLVARAERMQDEAVAIERETAGKEVAIEGAVRITAPDAFSARVLMPIVAALLEKHASLEVELVADNRLLSLTKREADMAVRIKRPQQPGLVARKVAPFGYALYASRAYVDAYGMPGDDLTGHRLVGFDDDARDQRDARWIATNLRGGRVAFRGNTTVTRLAAAVAGIGIALLPAYIADPEPELLRIRSSHLRPLPEGDVWLVVHEDLRHAAKIRTSSDFIAAALARLSPVLRGRRVRRSE